MNTLSKKIKVVHIVDDLKTGGLERTLAMIVLGLDKDRFDTAVWCLAAGGAVADELKEKGMKVRVFNFSSLGRAKAMAELISALRKEKIDITHSWGLSGGVIGRISSVLAGVKVRILHTQSVYIDTNPKERCMDWFLSFFTTRIIACADAVKTGLVKYMHVDAGKIVTIYNSVDVEAFSRICDPAKVRSELGMRPDDIVIGSASRLIPIKGQSYLLKAAAVLMRQYSMIKVLIVGDGPSKVLLQEEAGRLGIADRVIFTGIRYDMPRMMKAMDIFVISSTVREGLPLTACEAQASSLPVIATDVGGNGEIIVNMRTGLLVQPEDVPSMSDAMKKLIDDPALARRLAEAGNMFCRERFSSREMVRKVEELYQGCIQ